MVSYSFKPADFTRLHNSLKDSHVRASMNCLDTGLGTVTGSRFIHKAGNLKGVVVAVNSFLDLLENKNPTFEELKVADPETHHLALEAHLHARAMFKEIIEKEKNSKAGD